ncbi:MAG: efflux RND transporter periplasmic adaptor subunit [Phycisphaerae bacterium]|nr:efflux RND transporter periplasmic adaptor subunit [Phycisphaerae bacterium]
MTRVMLPTAILVSTLSLIAWSARDALRPAAPVRVVRVVAKELTGEPREAAADARSGVSVQAPGWVEPDPFPIYVTALASGVIDKVLVLEGQRVEAGQVVAHLVDDDARLAVARAEAELARQQALLTAAQTDWDNPVSLERHVAVNKALLAETRGELARLGAMIAQQRAKLAEVRVTFRRLSNLPPDAVTALEVEQTEQQVAAQKASLDATEKLRPVIDAKVQRYVAELAAAERDLHLRVSLRRALDEAAAAVKESRVAVAEARLRLTRMQVTSPVPGVVMNRLVVPGAKVMFAMDSPHSAHIVHVYDPAKLQVRVDVPLADAAKIGVGQKARVVVEVLPDTEFSGEVTRFVHVADIGKNTVEVKVAIDGPSELLKPEMLARVKFLTSSGKPRASGDGRVALPSALVAFIPTSAVVGPDDEAYVWVVSPGQSRLARRSVSLRDQRDGDWVGVREGLQPGDALVAEPTSEMYEGQRVRIEDE